jgi:cbb3-type cytochrome oxidase maturation protein
MESLYLLIPISVLIVFIAIWVFLAMSDSGQFDDMLGPALRILQDNDLPEASPAAGEAKLPVDAPELGSALTGVGGGKIIKMNKQE